MKADPQIRRLLEDVAGRAPVDTEQGLAAVLRGRRSVAPRLATAAVIALLVVVGIAVALQRSSRDGGFFRPDEQPEGSIAVLSRSAGEAFAYDLNAYDLAAGESSTIATQAGSVTAARWSPDGTRIAFTVERDGGARYALVVANADGSQPYDVLVADKAEGTAGPDFISVAWSPDGALLAYSGRTPFRGRTVSIVGLDGTVMRVLDGHWESVAWSPDGFRLLLQGWPGSAPDGRFDLYTMRSDGTDLVQLTDDELIEHNPSWSPDGSRIVFARAASTEDANQDIFVMDSDGSNVRNLTRSPSFDVMPVWSPDGGWIAFASDRGGPAAQQPPAADEADITRTAIFVMRSDGSGVRSVLDPGPGVVFPQSWKP